MGNAEVQYLQLLERVLKTGNQKSNRTGIDTLSLFGQDIRFDLTDGFPLLTTKAVNFHAICVELLWLISGSTSIKPLISQKVHIWDEWPFKRYLMSSGMWEPMKDDQQSSLWKTLKKDFCKRIVEDPAFEEKWGNLGPVYGSQWRAWSGPDGAKHDQLANAIDLLRKDPHSRRILVNAWNVSDIPEMIPSGLPPCHYAFQFYVVGKELSLEMHMRSADLFLGVPFNIASYALLTHMVAEVTGLTPRYMKVNFNDAHIYENHIPQVQLQLGRDPLALPTLVINSKPEIDDFTLSDIQLLGYETHPAIKGEVAI